MRHPVRSFVKNEFASLTTIFALSAPVMAGTIAMGIDLGRTELAHKQALRAAEAGAVSAAVAYQANNNSDLNQEVTQVVAKYGFNSANKSTITVNRPPSKGASANMPAAVEVIITQPQPSYFAALVWQGALSVTGRAVAKGGPNICILALNPTASAAVGGQGSVTVNANNCSIYSNSADSDSISVGGSSRMSALVVSAVGNVEGQSSITATNGVLTQQNPTPDPYASVNFPSYSGCTTKSPMYQYTEYLMPGVYCGGMTLNSGANVTLSPGVYVMDQGLLTVNGGATLQGSGVTIVFTSSSGNNYASAKINGGAIVNLTPPSSGDLAGIVLYGDRAMPTGTTFNLGGGSYQYFGGAIYLPKGAISYAGTSTASTSCTQIVGDTINFVGNSGVTVNCTGVGVHNIGAAAKVLE